MRGFLVSFVFVSALKRSNAFVAATFTSRLQSDSNRAFGFTPTAMSSSKPQSDEHWRTVLSPQQFAVLRQKATERAGSSPLNKLYPQDGTFDCVACGTPLYTAKSKFDSGCGWPAFYEGLPGAIKEEADADGRRVEILCNSCGSHLGHVFKGEGFPTPTDERHCVNGICLNYKPAK